MQNKVFGVVVVVLIFVCDIHSSFFVFLFFFLQIFFDFVLRLEISAINKFCFIISSDYVLKNVMSVYNSINIAFVRLFFCFFFSESFLLFHHKNLDSKNKISPTLKQSVL